MSKSNPKFGPGDKVLLDPSKGPFANIKNDFGGEYEVLRYEGETDSGAFYTIFNDRESKFLAYECELFLIE